MPKIKRYDIIVIGSGGGSKISTPSSKLGYKVALCEKDRLGGTCLNRGCIPSKMLIHPADVAHEIETSDMYEIEAKMTKVGFSKLVNRVAKVIDEESFSINPGIEKNENIDWYRDSVKFVGEKLLQIGNDEEALISADRIFVVAGSRPHIPKSIKGNWADSPFMTSTEALRNDKQPDNLIVLGGGYIACELSHFFAALGTQCHIFVRSKLLRNQDSEIRDEFDRMFSQRKNINIFNGCVPTEINYEDGVYSAKYVDPETNETKILKADQLLVTTGTVPNSDLLQVEKSGIETDKNGNIIVDDYLRTNVKGVWAYGDIIGRYLFRHSANFEGQYLFETEIKRADNYPIDYVGMPAAVFSNPQVANVGLTEEECISKGIDYVKGVNKFQWSAMGMALRSELTGGLAKLLIEKKTRKILGCHVVGPEASVLIHEIIPLMRLNGKLDDLLYCVHVHPSLSEIMRNAARRARNALIEAGDDMPVRLEIA